MSQENGNVVFLNKPKRFTLEEARSLLPQVREITEEAVEGAAGVMHALERPDLTDGERQAYSEELKLMADAWASRIAKLGALAKGLWLVDFDSGGGYYCWRYDEPELEFFHGYEDGFAGRTPIQ